MLNLWFVIVLLVKWALVFVLMLGWLARTRDYDAGRMARAAALSLVVGACLPLGGVVFTGLFPEAALVPMVFWSVLSVDVTQGVPWFLTLLFVVYCGVTFILLFKMFLRILNALALTRQAIAAPPKFNEVLGALTGHRDCDANPQLRVFTQTHLFTDDCPAGPYTVGLFNPVIVLPYSAVYWTEATLVRVLTHELTHVVRRDWLWQNVLHLLAVFIWFIPSAWRVQQKFKWLIELHADDSVLAQGHNRSDYANDLMAIASDTYSTSTFKGSSASAQLHSVHAVTGLIDGSYCYERIAAVLDGARVRTDKPYKKNKGILVFVAVLVGLILGGIQLVAIPLEANAMSFEASRHNRPFIVQQGVTYDLGIKITKGVSKNAPVEVLPLQPIDEIIVIERALAYSKDEWSAALDSEITTLAKHKFNDISVDPSVSVHGYIAVTSAIPSYPKKAQKKKIEGQVIVQFNVLPNGKADAVRIAMATPAGVFNKVVLAAMEKSVFKPARVGGQVVTTKNATQTFTFKLTPDAKKILTPTVGKIIKTAQSH